MCYGIVTFVTGKTAGVLIEAIDGPQPGRDPDLIILIFYDAGYKITAD
jgi:hypothetical protein